jgi:hypothetical protein
MKKLFIGLAFLGFFMLTIPAAKAEIDPCRKVQLICPDGATSPIEVCEPYDYGFWYNLFCGC